ncbi:hypothetical protein [Streptomyces sp. NPDC089919]|uniref:hypothetical protein n=1 Tax=Streptomyces sp. NPDC089919 TaxID=3155188 RepID=UPI0034438FDA
MSAIRRLLVLSVLCMGPLTSVAVAEGTSAASVKVEAAVAVTTSGTTGEAPDDLTWGP